VLAVVLLLLSAVQAFAHPKVSPELRHPNSGKPVDVIVQFTSTPTDRHIDKVTGKGAALKHKLSLINGAAFKHLPASAVAQLTADPEVAYISPDRPVRGAALDYAPESVNAPWAWQALQQLGQAPSGVGVAVIDSGISPVADLYWYNTLTGAYGLRIVYSQNFVDSTTDALDYYGHGTHVAGIIAGAGWSSWGNRYSHTFRGIAPNTNLINLRALDQNGMGTDSSVIAAIQTAINLKSQYNIRVLNLSLGRQVYESYTLDPLCQAVEAAWKAGIVVVAAAGNQGRNDDFSTEGYGTIAAPGNDPYVITVGVMKTAGTSIRVDDTVASYSSKGPTAFDHVVKPDLLAPGNQIVSLRVSNSQLPKQYSNLDVYMPEYVTKDTKNTSSPAYMRLSGSSMAAPAVSGTAALMLQADPTLTPDTVKARLMKSASKTFPTVSTTVTDPTTGQTFTSYYDMFTVGAGYLDVQ
jgi:serine protease AprX